MAKTSLDTQCLWVSLAAVLSLTLLGDYNLAEAVADPQPVPVAGPVADPGPAANPEPCCRGSGLVAGALGFAGGFLIGRHAGRHHGCGGCGCGGCGGGGGCGGCGGGCGWCGGSYYGRKRRSLDDVMENDALEDLYWKISQQDQDQCGLKLVCELAQKDPNYLAQEELVILLPYRGREIRDISTYYGQYDLAAFNGQRGDPCNELYPLCIFTSAEMMLDYANNKTTMANQET